MRINNFAMQLNSAVSVPGDVLEMAHLIAGQPTSVTVTGAVNGILRALHAMPIATLTENTGVVTAALTALGTSRGRRIAAWLAEHSSDLNTVAYWASVDQVLLADAVAA